MEAPGQPIVSVILATRNRSALLSRAVKSVLGQSYPHFELIVLDEGSNDNTQEVLRGLTDSRVHIVRHEISRGPGAARNDGLEAAQGEFVAFLDDDDEFLPDKLKIQVDAFGKSVGSVGLIVSPVRSMQNGKAFDFFPYDGQSGNIFLHLLAGNTFPLTAALFRKHALPAFDDKLTCLEDIDFLVKVAQNTKVAWNDTPCAVVHLDTTRKRLSTDPLNLHKSFRIFQTRWFNDPDDSLLRDAQADLLVTFALRQFAMGNFDEQTRECLNKAYQIKRDRRRLLYRLQNFAGPAVLKWLHARASG